MLPLHPLLWGVLLCAASQLVRPAASLAAPAAQLGDGATAAPAAPSYVVQGQLDWPARRIQLRMRITLPAADARRGRPAWLLHVPLNRFLAQDTRGRRRDATALPFSDPLLLTPPADAELPAGFSPGGMILDGAEDGQGRPLKAEWLDNPHIPPGYSPQRGLLRLLAAPAAERPSPPASSSRALPAGRAAAAQPPQRSAARGSGLEQVQLRFTLNIPQRLWEGWHKQGLSLRRWLPELALWQDGGWMREVHSPRSGYWQVTLRLEGRLEGHAFLGSGEHQPLRAGAVLRSLPGSRARLQPALVLTPAYRQLALRVAESRLVVFYPQGTRSQARRLLSDAAELVQEVRQRFGWVAPPQLVLAPAIALEGQMRAMGSALLLIPQAWWKNPALLHRLFAAEMVRTAARFWIGGTILLDENEDAWLLHGLSGWLALDWFERRYGAQGGLHSLFDWLNPHYREHFYERRVREMIRRQRDVPLLSNLQQSQDPLAVRIALLHKSPLVLRMLHGVLGQQRFALLLQHCGRRFGGRRLSTQAFQALAEEVHQESLANFFRLWVRGSTVLDLAVGEVTQRPGASGGVEVVAHLQTSHLFQAPVEVWTEDANGQVRVLHWTPSQPQAMLRFSLPVPLRRLSVDPRSLWLEAERKNNEYPLQQRVRPLFDWVRNRDLLVTLSGRLSSSVSRGNILGLGVALRFNEEHTLSLLATTSQKQSCCGWRVEWRAGRILHPRLELRSVLEKEGTGGTGELGLTYHHPRGEAWQASHGLAFSAPFNSPGQHDVNLRLDQQVSLATLSQAYWNIDLSSTASNPRLRSDYTYQRHQLTLRQGAWLFGRWNPELTLWRYSTSGSAPGNIALGGAELLRGYPLVDALTYPQIAAASLASYWTLWQGVAGRWLYLQGLNLGVFYEGGRGWSKERGYHQQPKRRDVGLRLELTLNALNLRTFPFRIEIARPVGDEEYREPQLVLFGAWVF